MNTPKYKIGFTIGEPAGIGPEILLKVLSNQAMLDYIIPIVFAAPKVLSAHRRRLNIEKLNTTYISNPSRIKTNTINIVNIGELKEDIVFGKPTNKTGSIARKSLQRGVKWLAENNIDALVTLPIDKHNIKNEDFPYNGHTDYLKDVFKTETLMFMVADNIKIATVTNHIPISKIPEVISQELIETKLKLLIDSLIKDFGIEKPKIAILGLNPHAGDNGIIGTEEIEIILPALQNVEQEKNAILLGCYPADGFFANELYKKFDAVLAMYHDQGLIPFKFIARYEGVNFTAGLPKIRTSPDHGTAYDIAGKGIANEQSLLKAIFTAIDIIRNRKIYEDLPEPLQPQNPNEVRHFVNSRKAKQTNVKKENNDNEDTEA